MEFSKGLVAIAIVVLLVHAPELTGRIPASAELVLDAAPKAQLLQEALARGTLPFWTDRMFLGYPLLASGETGALDLVTGAVHQAACTLNATGLTHLDVRAIVILDLVLHHALFALALYALAGRLYRSPAARFGVAATMALSGFTLQHTATGGVMRALPYLPLLCLLAPATELALSSLCIGALGLAGDPAMALVVLVGWVLYVLAHELAGRGALARTARRCAPPLLIGTGLAACQLMPQLEAARQAGNWLSAGQSMGAGALTSWVLPYLHGAPGNAAETAGFVGLVPLLVAACGWGLVPGAQRRFALFAAVAALAANAAGLPRGAVLVELAVALAFGSVLDRIDEGAFAARWRGLARQALAAGLALALMSGLANMEPLARASRGVLFGAAVAGAATHAVALPSAAPWLAAIALGDSLGRFAPHVRGTMPRVERVSAPAELAAVAPGARVFVRPGGLDLRLELLVAAGAGNACLASGLGTVAAVARFPPASWNRFFGHEISMTSESVWARMSRADERRFDLANVTHMLARQNFGDLERVARSVGGSAYRRPGALGWAYLAVPMAGPVGALPLVHIEGAGPVRTATAIATPCLTVERHEEGLLDVRARCGRSGWLITAIGAAPGWEATVDGRPAPIAIAQGALMAVELGVGEHRVELRYVPRAFRTALGVSAACLALLALLVRARRRI